MYVFYQFPPFFWFNLLCTLIFLKNEEYVAYKYHRHFPSIEDNSNAFLIVGSNEGLLEHVTHCGVDHPHYYITALYGKCITRRSYSDVDPRSDPHVSVGDCLSSKLTTTATMIRKIIMHFFPKSEFEWPIINGGSGSLVGAGWGCNLLALLHRVGFLTLFGSCLFSLNFSTITQLC